MELLDAAICGETSKTIATAPTFSVIIPVFNAEKTLERCVDSLLNPNGNERFEILIVDDCSTDATLDLAKTLSDRNPRITVFRTEQNVGPGVARNLGVENSKGDWVLFVDADDVVEPDFFSRLAHMATETKADIIAFNARLNGPQGETLKERIRIDLQLVSGDNRVIDYLQDRIDRSVIHHAFRRHFLNRNSLSFRAGLHEDVDYMFNALAKATGVAVLDQPIYRKINTSGSIVNSLSVRHIEGFFAALDAICASLQSGTSTGDWRAAFLTGIVNVTATRLSAMLSPSIDKVENTETILEALYTHAKRSLAKAGFHLPLDIPADSFRTKYRIIFDSFIASMETGEGSAETLAKIAAILPKSWSCYDLHHSVFLGPGEIRTCCKRFTYEGELKGDVVLFGGDGKDFEFTYDDIRKAKNALYLEINRDNSDECRGCPFLKFEDWGKPLDQGVKYLSFEHHSLCNMRCTYCSETYYGGQKPAYDAGAFIDTLKEGKALENMEYIVWGGGEPTVDQAFPEQVKKLADGISNIKQRVISNATLFTETLADLLSEDRAMMVTSIDAGNARNFDAIRKYKHFDRVMANIRRYAEKGARNIVLKYILLPENASFEELDQFVALMKANGLEDCNFQISCDFKSDEVTTEQLAAIVHLHDGLRKLGVRHIFLDDLVWQRLSQVTAQKLNSLRQLLGNEALNEALEPTPENGVVVWGVGGQAQLLRKRSNFFKTAKIAYYVDPRENWIGTTVDGVEVRAPEALLDDELPVIIGAVQSAPQILDQFLALGLPANRLVRRLIL
ncbi:glycosyltransferase [Rhizobium sp. L1K21]|uniref:glycosyltransferase n=1 Tax=Rhizobium sp. L1K21 TaxID=2954933 RepID=UPI002093D762|nr:glycosyltransferase [Rhizobium sp. L1K21]MCO6188388.1 glycosyltransferase [Rhizobium sp. L1K21]